MSGPGLGKQALILSGGAVYAAYEVGVMKALFQGESPATDYQPPSIDIFSGTSAGSLNAAVMASQPGADSAATVQYLERVWLDGLGSDAENCRDGAYRFRPDLRKILDPRCFLRNPVQPFVELAQDTTFFAGDWFRRAINFFTTSASLGRRLIGLVDLSTVLSLEPFIQLLRQAVDLGGVRRSDKLLQIAATNWATGLLRLFTNADLTDDVGHDMILASCSFPGLPPVTIRGEPYVDGGYVMNTPLQPAIYAGADTLHVVYLDPDVRSIPLQRLYSTIDLLDKLYVIAMAATFNRDIELAADIDRGLDLVHQDAGGLQLSEPDARALLRTAGRLIQRSQIPSSFRKLTIHRYRPREELGGVAGLLNFDRQNIAGLIERGFTDAVMHDCAESQCVF